MWSFWDQHEFAPVVEACASNWREISRLNEVFRKFRDLEKNSSTKAIRASAHRPKPPRQSRSVHKSRRRTRGAKGLARISHQAAPAQSLCFAAPAHPCAMAAPAQSLCNGRSRTIPVTRWRRLTGVKKRLPQSAVLRNAGYSSAPRRVSGNQPDIRVKGPPSPARSDRPPGSVGLCGHPPRRDHNPAGPIAALLA